MVPRKKEKKTQILKGQSGGGSKKGGRERPKRGWGKSGVGQPSRLIVPPLCRQVHLSLLFPEGRVFSQRSPVLVGSAFAA